MRAWSARAGPAAAPRRDGVRRRRSLAAGLVPGSSMLSCPLVCHAYSHRASSGVLEKAHNGV